MKKHAKLSIAVCTLLAPAVVMAGAWSWTNGGGDFDWANPLNWDGGVVPVLDDTHVNNGDLVQINTGTDAYSNFVVLDGDTGIHINSGASLSSFGQFLAGNSPTVGAGNQIVVDGTLTVATEFGIGTAGVPGSGLSTLTVNPGGVVNANGGWMIAGHGASGAIVINGGTTTAAMVAAGWGGNGSITMNGGVLDIVALILGNGAGTTGDLTMNGGLLTVGGGGLNMGAGAGTQTIDLNGGIVTTTGGFADGANTTFTIGNGQFILPGTYDEVHAIASGVNWSYDDQKYVFDNGDGTITITSIPEPATMGLMALFGGAMFAARRMFA